MTNDPLHLFQRLEKHLAETGFQGVDPHEGLNSPFVKALTFGRRYMGIAALQFFKRVPIKQFG